MRFIFFVVTDFILYPLHKKWSFSLRISSVNAKPLIENFIFCIVTFHCNRFHGSFQLTHFWPMFPFYTSWKLQKTKGFLVFSGGIKRRHWLQMGWQIVFETPQLSFSLAKLFSCNRELYWELSFRCSQTFCYLRCYMYTRVFKLIFY